MYKALNINFSNTMERKIPRMPFVLQFDQRFDGIEDESDENPDSSDDELDIILHGTPKQKRKLSRSLSRGSLELSSSSEDEFEKEMERELNETVRRHEEQYLSQSDKPSSSGNPSAQNSTTAESSVQQGPSLAQQFYDDIYFDSDDSDLGDEKEKNKDKKDRGKKKKPKHKVVSNDELLYDPDIDDENQKWVDRQRQKYRNRQQSHMPPRDTADTSAATPAEPRTDTVKGSPGPEEDAKSTPNISKPPKSDALLNCPACLTTLCLDCQRHELYNNQYRAMFVLNCSIIKGERLRYPVPKKSRRWNKNKKKRLREEVGEGSVPNGDDSEELYFPVKCSVCNTEVAVYDEDEVFHFFNVLESTA